MKIIASYRNFLLLFLISTIGLLFNVSTLFRGVANPNLVCGQQIWGEFLKIRYNRFENCDSILFENLYLNPISILDNGSIWQSRPGYILISLIFKPIYGNHTVLPFVTTNFLILILASFLTNKLISEQLIETKINPKLVFSAYLFIHSSIWFNPVTRAFFWTPHFQMFNILVPVLAIYFATLVFRKRFKLSALRYLFLGSFMLFYSSAIVILLLVIISLFLNRNYGLKYLPIFLVPYALWVSLNIFYSGSFYDHATKKYRQYIWILDDFQKDNGLAIFADHLQKNLGNFFYTFSDLTLLLNFSIILMFIILFVFLRIPIHSNLITATLKIVSLLLIILWVSLALNSFYAARLNWTLVISLQIGLCLFGIYTMSQLQNLNRSFCGKSISSELIGFLFVSYALIQIGIFCLFDGPFS